MPAKKADTTAKTTTPKTTKKPSPPRRLPPAIVADAADRRKGDRRKGPPDSEKKATPEQLQERAYSDGRQAMLDGLQRDVPDWCIKATPIEFAEQLTERWTAGWDEVEAEQYPTLTDALNKEGCTLQRALELVETAGLDELNAIPGSLRDPPGVSHVIGEAISTRLKVLLADNEPQLPVPDRIVREARALQADTAAEGVTTDFTDLAPPDPELAMASYAQQPTPPALTPAEVEAEPHHTAREAEVIAATLPPAAPTKKRTEMTIDELQAEYARVIGRPTKSSDRGYFLWKLREAEKGKIPVGPRGSTQAAAPAPREPRAPKQAGDEKVLAFRWPVAAVEALAGAQDRLGHGSHGGIVAAAVAEYLTGRGEVDAARAVATAADLIRPRLDAPMLVLDSRAAMSETQLAELTDQLKKGQATPVMVTNDAEQRLRLILACEIGTYVPPGWRYDRNASGAWVGVKHEGQVIRRAMGEYAWSAGRNMDTEKTALEAIEAVERAYDTAAVERVATMADRDTQPA